MRIPAFNPLFVKEVKTLFRGKGFPIICNVYLFVLMLLLVGILLVSLRSYSTAAWDVGRSIVTILGAFQLICLCLIAPSLAAASMSLERDRDTYDVLMVMPLSLGRIVLYKTMASLMFLFLLGMATAPFLAGGFVLGGVAPMDLVMVTLLTLSGILMCGSLGLMFSALFKRTIIAVPGACLTVGIVILGAGGWALLTEVSITLEYANPVTALLNSMKGAQVGLFVVEAPVWLPSIVFMFILCVLCLSVATEALKFPGRRTYAMTGLFLLILCGAIQVLEMGNTIRSSTPNLEKGNVFILAIAVLVLGLLIAAPHASLRSREILLAGAAKPRWRRMLSFLARPGAGLTLSGVVLLSAIWVACTAWHPALRGDAAIIAGPPLLMAACVAFFATLHNLLVRLRRWKYPVIAKCISVCVFIAFIGTPHLISMVAHAKDNEPTRQPLDVLLLLSPAKACAGMTGGKLDPYPFLVNLLGATPLHAVTIAAYAILALLIGVGLIALSRVKTRRYG